MGFSFNFRLLADRKDLSRLVNFLHTQSLGYLDYDDWVQRAEHEIDSGYKTAVLGFSSGYLVADLIYQPHKQLVRVREIKNLRVHPSVRRRDFAHFMLKQAEVESPDYQAIICDVRKDQPEAMALLRLAEYVPIASVSLYDTNIKDMVMIKVFDKTTESGIVYRSKQLILGRGL